jgi:hypothetical protein
MLRVLLHQGDRPLAGRLGAGGGSFLGQLPAQIAGRVAVAEGFEESIAIGRGGLLLIFQDPHSLQQGPRGMGGVGQGAIEQGQAFGRRH